MPDWFEKIVTFMKLPMKYLWIASLFSGLTLFLPADAVKTLGLDIVLGEYRPWLGTLFIFSTCLVFGELVHILYRKIRENRKKSLREAQLLERLYNLDPHEKSILREFFLLQRNTLQLPYDNATVSGLINHGILKLSGRNGERSLAGILVPMKIEPKANEFLSFDMIELPNLENPSEEEIDWLKNNRPEFAHEISRHNSIFHRS